MSDVESMVSVSKYKPLRVWIPILLLPLMLAIRYLPDLIQDGPPWIWMASAFGPFLFGLLVMLWWVLASRARWFERLLGVVGIFAILFIVNGVSDPSMGMLVPVMTIPMTIAGFAIALIALAKRLSSQRTLIALAVALLCASFSALLKTDGVWGNFAFSLNWRWSKSSEDRFLSEEKASTEVLDLVGASFDRPEWPGFRGPNQDGTQHGLCFSSDWKTTKPKELWRVKVGPAWSSFAVAGNYLVTQEQRGDSEAIVCYKSDTGEQAWAQLVESRFFDSLGGLGPRATPTIANGAVYAMGAEGWLMKLNATNGKIIWKADIRKAADRTPPMWGFSSSPLVDGGLVIIHAGGKQDKGILAFDAASGDLKWSAPAGEQSYSSPQIMTILDKRVIVLLSDSGAHVIEPSTGSTIYDYDWKHQGYRALEAQSVAPNKLLIPTGLGTGTRLVEITQSEGAMKWDEVWTSRNMKPDFNDLVVHNGYCYGFDSAIFACIDLKDGKQKWKGGRYGKGQVLLLADSDLLLIVAESGKLVLLKASPDSFQELAEITAMEGKTWNHPVVVGDRLFIRNAEEAVCYQLPLKTPR